MKIIALYRFNHIYLAKTISGTWQQRKKKKKDINSRKLKILFMQFGFVVEAFQFLLTSTCVL